MTSIVIDIPEVVIIQPSFIVSWKEIGLASTMLSDMYNDTLIEYDLTSHTMDRVVDEYVDILTDLNVDDDDIDDEIILVEDYLSLVQHSISNTLLDMIRHSHAYASYINTSHDLLRFKVE